MNVLVIFIVVWVFIMISIINVNTKKPDDCKEDNKECASCSIRCIHNMNNDEKRD